MDATTIISLISIAIIFAIVVANYHKSNTKDVLVKYSYSSKKQIMTNAEKIFYDKLLATIGDSHYIVPQAHLSMFIDHKIKGQNWKGAFSVINGKSVDFLIVEKATQKPVLAIELDDYTHGQPERVRRDAIVDEILRKANLPVQRYANNDHIQALNILRKEKVL